MTSNAMLTDNVMARLKRSILVDGFDIVLDFEKSRGSHLFDAKQGRAYIDLFSFFASLPLGFNHPRLLEPDFLKTLQRVSIQKVSNADIYSHEYADFVETFHDLTIRDHFKYLFFISGGALAVENALKAAFDWKVRKNLDAGRDEKGYQALHLEQAFHGRSGYTLSLTNTFDPAKTDYFPKFKWPRVKNPKCRFPLEGKNLEETIADENTSLAQIQEALKAHPHDIACIVLEPIQGEGGDNHFRPAYLKELRRICDTNDVLLVFDEVQTGMGMVGKWWAYEKLDVRPDLIAFGKKSQVCGIAATDRMDQVDHVFKVSSRINSTFGGSLTDMVRCQRYCRIIEEENLLDYVEETGNWFLNELKGLAKQKEQISNVRGSGLMIAFDLPDTDTRNRVRRECYSDGVIILPCGNRSLRVRPSLNIPREDLSTALEVLSRHV